MKDNKKAFILLFGILALIGSAVIACPPPNSYCTLSVLPKNICVGDFVNSTVVCHDCSSCTGISRSYQGSCMADLWCLFPNFCYDYVQYCQKGTYTITANCSGCCGGTLTETVKVIGVKEILANRTVCCESDLNGFVLTAMPEPDGPMNCLCWTFFYRETKQDQWRVFTTDYGGSNPKELDRSCVYLTAGYYKAVATNGSMDPGAESEELEVVRVDLNMLAVVENSPLPAGRICSNAQEDFRKAKWQATVKPADTTATVSASGPVTLSTAQVGDGDIFWAESTDLEANGDYSVTITHNDCSDCPATKDETVFKFDYYTYIDHDYTASGRNSELCGIDEGLFGLNAPRGMSSEEPSNEQVGGWVQQGRALVIVTDPYLAYMGNVKKRFKFTFESNGNMTISNGYRPSEAGFASVSINFDILQFSYQAPAGSNGQYGSSIADASGYLKIGNDIYEGEDQGHNFEEVGFPFFLWNRTLEDFSVHVMKEYNDTNRLYAVEVPFIALGRTYVSSNAVKYYSMYYETRVEANSQFIEVINIEPIGDAYEIPND